MKHETLYSPYLKHWDLDTSMTFLNHAAFGATPRAVMQQQTAYRAQLERQPLRFFMREQEQLIAKSKQKLGAFIGANPDNFVFVQNATQGVNTILHSLKPEKDDEWLITSLNYGACVETFKWYAQKNKLKLNTATLHFPVTDENDLVEAVVAAVTPKTRLVLLDHITSATGIILPIQKIMARLHGLGVNVLIDGAHAPGMLPLDIESLGATYYVGNCHKWICSPKGSAFLWVKPEKQPQIAPLQLSHFHDRAPDSTQHWSNQFVMTGTMDYSPYFCVPTAIDFFENEVENGWIGVRSYNHNLVLQARNLLLDALGKTAAAPDAMLGNLATILLNDDVPKPSYGYNFSEGLQDYLFHEHQIEIPVFYLKNYQTGKTEQYLRIACQVYNALPQYEYLAEVLKKYQTSKNKSRLCQ